MTTDETATQLCYDQSNKATATQTCLATTLLIAAAHSISWHLHALTAPSATVHYMSVVLFVYASNIENWAGFGCKRWVRHVHVYVHVHVEIRWRLQRTCTLRTMAADWWVACCAWDPCRAVCPFCGPLWWPRFAGTSWCEHVLWCRSVETHQHQTLNSHQRQQAKIYWH